MQCASTALLTIHRPNDGIISVVAPHAAAGTFRSILTELSLSLSLPLLPFSERGSRERRAVGATFARSAAAAASAAVKGGRETASGGGGGDDGGG